MTTMRIVLAGAGMLVAMVLLLPIARQVQADEPPKKDDQAAPPTPEVAVVEVKPRSVALTNELPGRTSAYLVAEVRPQVSGLIQKRLFEEGADVKEGQALYQIDPSTFQAALESAQANLVGAQKTADRARAAVESGTAAVEQQRAVLELSLTNRNRLQALAKDGAVSLSERDKAVTESEVAQATLRATEAQVKSDRQAVEVAEAAILQSKAALTAARINMDYTQIKAPISGRIGRSGVTVGALVTAHQPLPLSTIQQLDPIYVDVPQSTADLLRLRRRLEKTASEEDKKTVNKVRLVLEDGTEYTQEGILQFRDVTVDQSTGSVIVRMAFPNPDGLLLPGMFVRAVVTEGIEEHAIMIPQQAVSRDTKGNPQALVVNKEGKVEQRPLTLERALGDEWLVSKGLTAGERVIVEGSQRVQPGAAVKTVVFNSSQSQPVVAEASKKTTTQAN